MQQGDRTFVDIPFVAIEVACSGYSTGRQGSCSNTPQDRRTFHNCVRKGLSKGCSATPVERGGGGGGSKTEIYSTCAGIFILLISGLFFGSGGIFVNLIEKQYIGRFPFLPYFSNP